MKTKERKEAILLRKQGESVGEIAKKLKVAKSSVSCWVRDVRLTQTQRERLNKNGHSIDAIEKRRIARLANTKIRREKMVAEAIDEVAEFSKQSLWCAGVALYWGEGGKTQQTVRLANSDPDVIKLIMKFFLRYSEVPKEKFRGHIHTFSHQNVDEALSYWTSVSGIPKQKFYKTYVKKSSASKDKRDTLPYGTIQVYVHDTNFFFRLMGWIEGLKKL